MQLEQAHLGETFGALRAQEGPLSGVKMLMSAQIPRVLEGPGALLAGVRALACVCALVARHVRGTCEGFATVGTRVGVRPVMDGEGLWKARSWGFLRGCRCSSLELAVVLRVTVLDVLQQVRLLHVEKGTLRAGKDLGGHLDCGT